MENKNYIMSLLALNGLSVPKLAKKMSDLLGEEITPARIYGKLDRNTLTLAECQAIAKILGYHIEFIKD